MCGIAGFLDSTKSSATELRAAAKCMVDALQHRGPDDRAEWVDECTGVALANARLAVLDLSPSGRQPMVSADGRWILVHNGEIYNHRELRKELETKGIAFRGRSDTEVVVEALAAWGIHAALERFNGMFAFAAFDRREGVLHLGRDRMGEKPLYYGWAGSTFLFGSELKAIQAHRSFRPSIDREALALFFRHKYIPEPWSIYEGIRKLRPGCFVSVALGAVGVMPQERPYWSAEAAALHAAEHPFRGVLDDAVQELDALLLDAVRLRMESDVPLGALLSGGIDSSTVVALMQTSTDRPVQTFTVGFEAQGFDESSHARAVAEQLGTHHTEVRVTPADALDVIPRLPSVYDEPFADSSQIPTYLISSMARQHVTVVLSGDGGDELFGGYNRYVWVPAIERWRMGVPSPLRRLAAWSLDQLQPAAWRGIVGTAGPLLPARFRHRLPEDKLQKLVAGLRSSAPAETYGSLVTHWDPADIVDGVEESKTIATDPTTWPALHDVQQQMMFVDAVSYLPGDILAKIDRASMAVSLEVRAPFLDHRVVSFAWSLPSGIKIRNGRGKMPLRCLLKRFVEAPLVERPKMGFGVPIGEWLRGPLRAWAEDLLDARRLRDEGYLRPEAVQAAWEEHLSGRRNRQYHLWDVLMFECWLESVATSIASQSAAPIS
jgi:asparagine synthase (glutamine-hydrolysing)